MFLIDTTLKTHTFALSPFPLDSLIPLSLTLASHHIIPLGRPVLDLMRHIHLGGYGRELGQVSEDWRWVVFMLRTDMKPSESG